LSALRERYHDAPSGAVAVHDAARPLVDREILRRGFESVVKGTGCVPVIECVNSLRRILPHPESADVIPSVSVIRKDYVEVQTPQIFCFDELCDAYSKAEVSGGFDGFTDDASVAESAGMSVRMYAGSPENIKVTHPLDFKIAGVILDSRNK
ncbi:MAG: 2-C-methyl-D-erythritol 4-phosphate cytidylyltransferase, partial [Muribaculaceae bacterium]|nr:2-C-methyl-D-erythritol 4-phosphate cytidylyltransferase [Muribaculaceae bacterium]